MFYQFWKERMRKNHLGSKEASSLYDIVFLMAAGFFVLFIVAFFYVNPVAKLGKINKTAEYIITVTWPDDLDSDIDTWVLDPNGTLIWYKAKTPNQSVVHLERDDLGHTNDTIIINGQKVIIKKNVELVTFRGIHPGRYILNLHYFRNNGGGETPVTVKIEKLNPVVKQVFFTEQPIMMLSQGQETTVIHFEIEIDGSMINISTDPPISLIQNQQENQGYYGQGDFQ